MVEYLKQSWLVLLLAGGLGITLSLVEASLSDRILKNAEDRFQKAVIKVVPGGVSSNSSAPNLVRVFDESQEQIGWALPGEVMGFADRIELVVGISLDGSKILGVAILSSRETPGLGDLIREQPFLGQFANRNTDIPLVAVKPGESASAAVDAISGATISSRAVVQAVNDLVSQAQAQLVDATTGSQP